MPRFDKNLDQELFSESIEFDKNRIAVSVFAYNNGTPKLQISREMKSTSGEYSFAKLGRLSKDEVEKIMPLMEKAKKFL